MSGTSTKMLQAAAGAGGAANVGLFAGNFTGAAASSVIEGINILTAGNATDFGDLSVARYSGAGMSSSTRAVFGGGNDRSAGNDSNHIDYVEFATAGTAIDFGDCTAQFRAMGGSSNGVYGGMFKGYEAGSATKTIQRVTIASTGNATDQGDADTFSSEVAACGNTTYAVIAGGRALGSSTIVSTMERSSWPTISSAGGFGNLTVARYDLGAASSSTRAIFTGGNFSGGRSNVIDYVTIATTGSASDFGDLTPDRSFGAAVSNKITAVITGASARTTADKFMDSVTIATTGNSVDFGEMLNYKNASPIPTSDSHGGISV